MAKEERIVSLKEFRAYSEDDGKMRLSGYASVFDQPTVLFTDDSGNEYREVIDKHAFDGCDFSKCCLKYNHESSVPVLSRVRGGFMELRVDDYGLFFDATLFNTQTSRDIYEIVKEGGLTECSFAFTLADEGDAYDRGSRTRTITRVANLWDCAVVDNPAYGGTSVSARNFLEAEAEKDNLEKLEAEAREAQKRRIKILLEATK